MKLFFLVDSRFFSDDPDFEDKNIAWHGQLADFYLLFVADGTQCCKDIMRFTGRAHGCLRTDWTWFQRRRRTASATGKMTFPH
jgi:hypothetical protein